MDRFRKVMLCVLAIFSVIALGFGLAMASELEIFVKEEAIVKSAEIRLADIARFTPANDIRVGRLARIKIAPSPHPGSGFILDHSFLISKLSPILSKEKNIRVKIPNALHVRRATQVVKRKRLEEIFHAYLKKHAPWPLQNILIEKFSSPKLVCLPSGKLRWTARHQGRTRWVGPLSLVVTFWVNERPVRKIPISATLLVKQRFVRAGRKIVRGAIIGSGDIVVTEKVVDSFNDTIITDPKEVIGKQLLRTVRKGQILTRAMIKEVPWVRRGQQIRILAENEHIKVIATGKALEEGGAGDQVKVINIGSGKEIYATVKSPGLVKVEF